MAEYIDENVSEPNSILTDNAHTFGVILLSGRPDLFFDRIDRGDTVFRSVLDDPFGKVDYMLIGKEAENDLIRAAFPGEAGVDVPGLATAFETERYLLARVDAEEPEQVLTPDAIPEQTPESGGSE